jgi:hypothetical protein
VEERRKGEGVHDIPGVLGSDYGAEGAVLEMGICIRVPAGFLH